VKLTMTCLSAALFVASSKAFAQSGDPMWTLNASGSWSELGSSDRDAISASVSLSRLVGDASVGAALATSNGSDALFDQAEITDRSSVFASAWVVIPVEAAKLDLSVSFGQEDFEGRLALTGARFESLNGGDIDLTSDVDSFAVSAALSQAFIRGSWDIIPNASLGWSQSEATSTAAAIEGLDGPGVLSETQDGTTASLGLGLGYLAHDQLYVFSDVSGVYAENGASTSVGRASRTGGLRASSRQSPDEASWAELSIGASFFATDTLTLSLSGGATGGRDDEEVFATTTLSIGF